MKSFNLNKGIEDADDYVSYATDIFECFFQTFSKENGLIREIHEDDIISNEKNEGTEFMYTAKGTRLAEHMRDKLINIEVVHFPNDEWDIIIDSYLYIEL